MLLSSKYLCLLLYIGHTLAFLGVTRFMSDLTLGPSAYEEKAVWVLGRRTRLEVINAPLIKITDYLWNRGTTVLTTNEAAMATLALSVDYTINGFYNDGLFVVSHNKRSIPIVVTISGVWLKGLMQPKLSKNRGTMIFLANGLKPDTERERADEFVIEMHHKFVNLGSISVLGTLDIEAKFTLAEKNEGALFTNTGIIYVKQALFQHTANFAGEGCIVVGKYCRFATQNDFEFAGQRLHFTDGSATLLVLERMGAEKKEGEEFFQRYYITNFPRNTMIWVTGPIAQWRVEGSDFVVTNREGRESITFTFEGFTLDASKVRIIDNTMTYAEDLVRSTPHPLCAKMDLVIAEADPYELPKFVFGSLTTALLKKPI